MIRNRSACVDGDRRSLNRVTQTTAHDLHWGRNRYRQPAATVSGSTPCQTTIQHNNTATADVHRSIRHQQPATSRRCNASINAPRDAALRSRLDVIASYQIALLRACLFHDHRTRPTALAQSTVAPLTRSTIIASVWLGKWKIQYGAILFIENNKFHPLQWPKIAAQDNDP